MKNKKNILICFLLVLISIIYTLLVKYVDTSTIGPNGSVVGFSSLNSFVFNLTGNNMTLYKITEILGIIPILIALMYAVIGLIQVIDRKSLKVDKELIALGILYVVVILIYVFFEKCIINYRPVIIDGVLEASYPSSHTLLSICICGSSLLINKYLFNNKKIYKYINIVSIISMVLIVLGRLLSGVHWASDIIGSIIISITLLKILETYYLSIKKD
ncbi:MAG: phosphatase PAP2 family protein [bacterium]|nr:phosphatase PAP2 family protein [bacterium]MDY4108325.1 phosphatase PAP2 family protein [Bacilli bacterium]